MSGLAAMALRYRVRVREELDLVPSGADARTLRAVVAGRLRELLAHDRVVLPPADLERLVEQVVDDAIGLGPLEPLMRDPTVTEVIANGPGSIYVERRGRLAPEPARFRDAEHLRQVIERVVGAGGRRVDDASPMVDVRLPDGSRVNAVLPPLALDGPLLTIRRFPAEPMGVADLVELGTLTSGQVDLLAAAVRGRANVVISGGTGTGKTTLLNALAAFVDPAERLVTVEDAAELRLPQERNAARLESRPPNVEGRGEVTLRALVRNALRMRPDRIVVGEVRGGEALDMLQAMNTGHDGSLTTVHASSPADALRRIETMALMAGLDLPHAAVREQVRAAVDVVVHLVRSADGARAVRWIDGRDPRAGLRPLDDELLRGLVEARCPGPSP
jgi:pilus assembly protein CpaF